MKLRSKIMSVILSAVIAAGAFSAPVQERMGSAAVTAEAAASVAAPTAELESGDYMLLADTGTIPLNCSTKNAKIYYSVNGSKYKLYKGGDGVPVTKNTTLKIYAKKNGSKSKTVTYKYAFAPQFTVSKKPGTYSSEFRLKLNSDCTGVKYYYTLDGSAPTTKSKRCYPTTGIKISKTCTVKIIGVKTGLNNSIFTGKYTIGSSFGGSSSGDTVTSSCGEFSASAGKADILLNGTSYSPNVSPSSQYQFCVEKFGGMTIELRINPDLYEAGDTLTLDDFIDNDDNLRIAFYGSDPITCNQGIISTTYATSYIKKLDITIEEMDTDGIAAVTLDAKLEGYNKKGYGPTTVQGLLVVDLGSGSTGGSGGSEGSSGGGSSGGSGSPSYGSDRCMKCHGSGICPTCNGKRKWYTPNYGTDVDTTVTCSGCNGSGRCWGCGGTGRK